MIPREKIDDVRERTNIVEIIKRHVELKRAGTGSWKGLCPFHGEKTPSFNVSEQRQTFYCFGCQEKGDVIGFLVKIEQRSFMEVLQELAGAAGVDLDVRPLSPAERAARKEAESERDRMLRLMETAAAFFEEQYASPAGEAARAYVEKRGISKEVAARFRVGYAPGKWSALSEHLAQKKFPASDMERLGLVGVNERGRYDFFRDRVMLPVMDRQKRVIGFGGRLLDPEAKDRKYVNSPDSPLFHKKEQLYGLHAALDAIRRGNHIVLVEGNFDVMSLHEAGIEDAVAPMGTALTAEQIAICGRMARTVTVVFDGDAAGQRAAHKVIPMFVDADVDGRVARMPTGVDPDDFVRANGAEAFRRLVESARPMLDQFIQDSVSDASIPSKAEALDTIAKLLVRVKNPTVRELYVSKLAGVMRMDLPLVRRAMANAAAERAQKNVHASSSSATPGAEAQAQAAPARPAPRKLSPHELHAVVLLAAYPELLVAPEAARVGELLLDPALRQLHRAAVEQAVNGKLDTTVWLDAAAPDVQPTVAAALMDDSIAKVPSPSTLLRKLVARLELLRVDAEISMNERQVDAARTRGDESTAHALIRRGFELKQTKLGLQAALERP